MKDDKSKDQPIKKSMGSRQRGTELKASETEGRWAERELRESEEKYRKLFSISPIGTALFGLDGKYIEVNDDYAKILGLPRNELLNRAVSEFSEEKELEKIQEDINELLAKGVNGGVRELHIEDNDLVLSYVNTLLYDDEKKPVGVISMIQDITELKGLEQAIKKAREFTEDIVETVREPLIEPHGELREIPKKRDFFGIFRAIPKKIEQGIVYDLKDRRWEVPKLSKLLGKIFHKSIDLDDFVYELESQTFWRRKFKGDKD